MPKSDKIVTKSGQTAGQIGTNRDRGQGQIGTNREKMRLIVKNFIKCPDFSGKSLFRLTDVRLKMENGGKGYIYYIYIPFFPSPQKKIGTNRDTFLPPPMGGIYTHTPLEQEEGGLTPSPSVLRASV